MARATNGKNSVLNSLNVPISIFNDSILTKNELLVEYLKLYQNQSYGVIADLISRDVSTVQTLFTRAKKKRAKTGTFLSFNLIEGTIPTFLFKEKELTYDQIISKYKNNIIEDKPFQIPIEIFNNKSTFLTLLVKYCREILGLKFKEIGTLIGRNEKSLINTYARVKNIDFSYSINCIHVPIFILLKPLSIKENLFLYLNEILAKDFEDISNLFNLRIKEVERIILSARRKRRGVQ